MRYCDKCGCAISSGGHKSAAQGLFSTPYLCDDCYAQETESATKAVGCFAKLFIGILIGLAMTGGVLGIVYPSLLLLVSQFASSTDSWIV